MRKALSGNRMRLSALCLGILMGISSCAFTTLRPVQEMSIAQTALKAAKEAQADTLAPELFRQASDSLFAARREYRLKNYKDAKDLANKARGYAELAELESLKNGGKHDDTPPDPLANAAAGGALPQEGPTPPPDPVSIPSPAASADPTASPPPSSRF